MKKEQLSQNHLDINALIKNSQDALDAAEKCQQQTTDTTEPIVEPVNQYPGSPAYSGFGQVDELQSRNANTVTHTDSRLSASVVQEQEMSPKELLRRDHLFINLGDGVILNRMSHWKDLIVGKKAPSNTNSLIKATASSIIAALIENDPDIFTIVWGYANYDKLST